MSQYDDDFWGNDEESTGEAELGGGSFEVIPKGTRCKAHIEEIEWRYYGAEDEEKIPYVKMRWSIEEPSDYENRKVFHDLKIYGEDPSGRFYDANKQDKKMENSRAMFWAVDKNCGGKLAALKRKPTDEELQRYLIGKPMYITLDVWETEDKFKSGNWVRKIEPLNATSAQQPQKAAPKQQAKPQPKAASVFDDTEDIPF